MGSAKEHKWNVEDELKLLQAVLHNKPIGVNKHFSMVKIVDQLRTSLKRHITTDEVWAHLETMYNLKALDDFETVPFPNEEIEFSLPESEFPQINADSDDETNYSHESPTSPMSEAPEPPKLTKSRLSSVEKAAEENTPKRIPKRTRNSTSNTVSPAHESPASTKRRRF